MKIKSITIIKGHGCDKVMLHTDLAEACYPYNGELVVDFSAAQGNGQKYCIENFHGIQIKVIECSLAELI